MITVSIITVCLNAEDTIERTIESVLKQTYENIEYIIVDGNSEDRTAEIIESYESGINTYIRESDEGVYHAMNKAISVASGDIVYFLNADDEFVDEKVLSDVVRVFNVNAEITLVYGNIIWRRGDATWTSIQPSSISREYLARTTLLHQSAFVRRELFSEIGMYKSDYKVVADYRWFLEYFMNYEPHYSHIDRIIAIVGTEGLSHSEKWESERIDAMRSVFSWWEIMRYRMIPRYMRQIFHTLKIVKRWTGG